MHQVKLIGGELVNIKKGTILSEGFFVRNTRMILLQIDRDNSRTHLWKKGDDGVYHPVMTFSFESQYMDGKEGLRVYLDAPRGTFTSGERNSVIL